MENTLQVGNTADIVAAPAPQQNNSPAVIIDAIKQIATNPDVDIEKLHSLLDLQERMLAKQAEMDFNADFAAMQAKLPRIKKDSKIEYKGKVQSTYATYEAIDDKVRDILNAQGFSIRYNTEQQGSQIKVHGTLSHRGGHSINGEITLALDTSGSKNSVQGVGSTVSYGKRYVIGMLLNLVFEGEDDNAKKAAAHEKINAEMATELKGLIEQLHRNDIAFDMQKFLHYVDAPNVDSIALPNYDKARHAINQKLNANKGEKADETA